MRIPLLTASYDVRDKVAVVSGAGSGIGAALVEVLHDRGASVALIDVNEAAIEAAASRLGERAMPVAADVRDRVAMADAMHAVAGRFGCLDVVVANAGVAPAPATLRTIEPDEFDRVIDINLTGVFNTVQPALDQVTVNRGHIVVVSSAAAFAPGAGLAPYMISKAGVEQLGRALRIELASSGATAGVAYFGFVSTPLAAPLDEDPLGRRLDDMLPWPLNQRISAQTAARVIADAVAARAARTIAPAGWGPYAMLRGPANVLIDNRAAASATMSSAITEIERRTTTA